MFDLFQDMVARLCSGADGSLSRIGGVEIFLEAEQ